jgi:hypothetical protein
MPQYEAIEEYLLIVTKLCGEQDQFLRYLISMAVIHCVDQHQNSHVKEQLSA